MPNENFYPLFIQVSRIKWQTWVSVGAPSIFYEDAFRLYTGEVIIGELLSFDGITFKIKTERGIIEKKEVI